MPGGIEQHSPAVATGLEDGLARAQFEAPPDRLRHIIGVQVHVVTLGCGRVGPA
jgi:hypothetical protein